MKQFVIHYGELSTKGRNRKSFQNKLAEHIRYKTRHIKGLKVQAEYDFMYVRWENPNYDYEDLLPILAKIPGIARFEPVYEVTKELESIKERALDLFQELKLTPGETFKVRAKRSDKSFPYDTYAIQREVGAAIGTEYPQLAVDLKEADYCLTVSIHQLGQAYLSLRSYPGLGGLPYGSSGKGMLMLSGGFDSPVAGYEMMKRGMVLEMVHFSSPPYTSPQALRKVKELVAQLAHYGMAIKFHNVPFARIQKEIKERIPDASTMTLARRMMLRIMDQLLEQNKASAIVNGESLGQVASQTLQSMKVINEVTCTPILRPLISRDKNDIIEIANQIGTADISNQPFEDCCTVFAPKSPHTSPKSGTIEEFETRLDIQALIEEAVSQTESEWIDVDYFDQEVEAFSDLL